MLFLCVNGLVQSDKSFTSQYEITNLKLLYTSVDSLPSNSKTVGCMKNFIRQNLSQILCSTIFIIAVKTIGVKETEIIAKN